MSAWPESTFADDRGDLLLAAGVNGMRFVRVALNGGGGGAGARLELTFWNPLHLAAIVAAFNDPSLPPAFRIRGGSRILGGSARGQVQVAEVALLDERRLKLLVAPEGDYSTYTLELLASPLLIDPFFASIGFKFRPGCFNHACDAPSPGKPAATNPTIDYLAKDHDSFRHTLMAAMAERVPGWVSSSQADHDQVLIELFAAAADELSDYQDRVANEAYFGSARKRLSLVRHARLMDYHVHEGNQASTWIVVEVLPGLAPLRLQDEPLVITTLPELDSAETMAFASREHRLPEAMRTWLDPRLNQLRLHTWRHAVPALHAGATSADLVPLAGLAGEAEAKALAQRVVDGDWRDLLIAESLNPLTGRPPGRDPRKRQRLRLQSGEGAASVLFDPVEQQWLLRVYWVAEDALRADYAFVTVCDDGLVEDVSVFYGNLLPVYEGRPMTVHFHEPGALLPSDTACELHRWFERSDRFGNGLDWVFAPLPDEGPLANLPPEGGGAPTGELAARSTLAVQVEPPGGAREDWDEVESLVHSDASAEQGDHFAVETDEARKTVLRFGNGSNGRLIARGSVIHTQYQVGGGRQGNVGAERLRFVQPIGGALAGAIVGGWNPFDVADGRDPETPERIRRNAPEAFRARQLRAVTLADYVARAEEVPGVARAAARYAWTGSWRTVQLAIDPAGFVAVGDEDSDRLWAELEPRVQAHLDAVRLIGEDLEVGPPRYVPLDIAITVCATPETWREDLRQALEAELSDGYTTDGRTGLFHPDRWSFGQALHRSVIEGRLHAVAGVEHLLAITMRRFNQPTPGAPAAESIELAADEVLLLAGDPDHLERGRLRIDVRGGRQ